MRTMYRRIGTAILLLLIDVCVTGTVLAQRQYRDSDSNMRNLIRRIETRTDTFSRTLESALDRSRPNNTARRDEINRLVTDFESATNQLKTRFENRQSTSGDVRTVLSRAALINQFLANNRLDTRGDQDWRSLQADLDQLARAYNITDWRWTTGDIGAGTGAGTGYGRSEAQLRQLVRRIETRTNQFSRTFRSALNRNTTYDSSQTREAQRHLTELETATIQLRNRLNSQGATSADVQELLDHAAYLNSFLANNQLNARAESDWSLLKSDLDQLASSYNIAWNWTTSPGPGGTVYGSNGELTGTYRLNASQSASAREAADNATRTLPASQRQRVYDSLIRRLDPPEMLAIDKRGDSVTIASSRAPQINFVADGREHVETNPNGRTVRVRATLSGNKLVVERTGERAQDFTVTFDPIDNGRRLLVTRKLYTDQLNQPVTVQSYYDRTSDVAQLNLYDGRDNSGQVGEVSGDFVIPSGTQLVGVLNSNLSTQTVKDNDRFTVIVRSPSQYDGATIEGYVTNVNRSGRITGRSEMTLNFERIRLRDGRTSRFAGIVESVRTPGNETVSVDNEGAVRDDDQTGRTVTRTAIGGAVGAIIGAIAGGGKGAAIGAVLGGGAGAGSVYVQGRDDLELPSGTEVTIRATGPR